MRKLLLALVTLAALVTIPIVLPAGVTPTPAESRASSEVPIVIRTRAETDLSASQSQMMRVAFQIARSDGHQRPEVLQSILLQETNAGAAPRFRVSNPGPNAVFGAMQLKLSSAKEVLKQFPTLFQKYHLQTRTDDEIKANLILNDAFNIEIASKYLLTLKRRYRLSDRDLLAAYNRGPNGNFDESRYAAEASQKLVEYKGRQRKV